MSRYYKEEDIRDAIAGLIDGIEEVEDRDVFDRERYADYKNPFDGLADEILEPYRVYETAGAEALTRHLLKYGEVRLMPAADKHDIECFKTHDKCPCCGEYLEEGYVIRGLTKYEAVCGKCGTFTLFRGAERLPDQYKEWLSYSDGGEIFPPTGIQLYGVSHKPLINWQKNKVAGSFANGDVIAFRGDEVIVISCETGDVTGKYPDFFSFLKALPDILGL